MGPGGEFGKIDLARWQGQQVSVGLRVRAQEAPAGMQAGFERCILVGFAEPRIVAR